MDLISADKKSQHV